MATTTTMVAYIHHYLQLVHSQAAAEPRRPVSLDLFDGFATEEAAFVALALHPYTRYRRYL